MIGALVSTGRRRNLAAGQHRAIVVAAALFSAWVVYANLFTISDPLVLGILFVSGIYAIMFAAIGATPYAPDHVPFYDVGLSLLSLVSGIFFFVNATAIADRISLLDPFTPAQLFFGFSLLLLTLEATRRTTGMGLTIVVVAFLAYNWFGYLLPPPFGHGVDDVKYLLDILVFTTDGVFGVPIQVVASYVFLFVMFGTFLSKAGGGEFFFNLAALLTGRARGGPAKIAVISSGLYGTMSGSPTSDVVATGSITIPVMKRLGYSARFAAAVEVAASTGGSAMPPVMGSAAFILAEYTGVDYKAVVVAALVPALLYYLGVFSQVHLRAVRDDLRPSEDEIPTVAHTFRTGWVFLLPIIGIVVALLSGYSPTFTAGIGVIGVVIASMILKATRMSPWQIIEGLGETTLRILPVAGACAAAGLVIGGLSMTGLGMKLTAGPDAGDCRCGDDCPWLGDANAKRLHPGRSAGRSGAGAAGLSGAGESHVPAVLRDSLGADSADRGGGPGGGGDRARRPIQNRLHLGEAGVYWLHAALRLYLEPGAHAAGDPAVEYAGGGRGRDRDPGNRRCGRGLCQQAGRPGRAAPLGSGLSRRDCALRPGGAGRDCGRARAYGSPPGGQPARQGAAESSRLIAQ